MLNVGQAGAPRLILAPALEATQTAAECKQVLEILASQPSCAVIVHP
jgi:hypothetical protein